MSVKQENESKRQEDKSQRGAYGEYRPILFHVSPIENAKSIEERGIVVPKGHSYVSLSMDRDSWYAEGMCLFEVNVEGLEHEMRTFLPELDEIIVFGSIGRDRVRRVK